MGRRRKEHGDSRLASDQIPAQNQNNICLRPCHSLWYHHQAFRDDTQCYSTPLPPQMQATTESGAMQCVRLIGSGGRKRTLRKKRNGVQAVKI